jgi:glycosyltransferase involved in cell wall biosynthesis
VTTTLRVIVDEILAPSSGGLGRYTEELTRQLIRTAPDDCEVNGIVSASPASDYAKLETLLPDLGDVTKTALSRRELQVAWQLGVTRLPGGGMVHAPSLLAPLYRHDRVHNTGDQTVVTIHDTLPWTYPDSLGTRETARYKAMAKRAHKYADAIVVPTHAVASELSEIMNFGERIRVIGGAVGSNLLIPHDADERAARLELPEQYLLTVGSLDPRKGIASLIRSLGTEGDAGLPLVIAGANSPSDDAAIAKAVADAGLAEGRVRSLGYLSDEDLSVALDRASVFVFPSLSEGFGLPMLEAFHFGTPVVHSDAPALVEVAAEAGVVVARSTPDSYPERLAEAVSSVLNNPALAQRLRYAGFDRASAFSWRDSAQRVWQLHADL